MISRLSCQAVFGLACFSRLALAKGVPYIAFVGRAMATHSVILFYSIKFNALSEWMLCVLGDPLTWEGFLLNGAGVAGTSIWSLRTFVLCYLVAVSNRSLPGLSFHFSGRGRERRLFPLPYVFEEEFCPRNDRVHRLRYTDCPLYPSHVLCSSSGCVVIE